MHLVYDGLTSPRATGYRWNVATATLPLTTDTYATPDSQRTGYPLQRTELLLIFAFWTALAVLTAASRLLDERLNAIDPSPR